MTTDAPIGRVIATENHPTSTGSFRFWLSPGFNLKPFDFVRVEPPENGDPRIGSFYAIIDEILQVSDESSPLSGFISSDFGNSSQSPRVGRVVTTYADATVLYNTNDIEMPVPHGSRVHWPDENGVRKALGIDEFRRNTPAGFITMTGPDEEQIVISVDMDADYLIGPEGAHLNISGISGLATKTSYAVFILSAIQQRQRSQEWNDTPKASFVILNVKGCDLLHVHESAVDLNDRTRDDWKKCGLEPEPLSDVSYFFPFSSNLPGKIDSMMPPDEVELAINAGTAYRFYYDVGTTLDRMHLLFEDMDDPNQTLVSCVDHCRDHVTSDDPWNAFHRKVKEWSNKTPDSKILVGSWRRFSRLFQQRTKNGIFTEETNRADEYKQILLSDELRALKPGHVAVVDIAQLPDYLQAFVVGDIITALRDPYISDADDEDQARHENFDTVILFADELNKFAPKHGKSRSLIRHLQEISERGRSEGIILFGAEQFRTAVDDRVTGNSSTHVFGRTTAVESRRDDEIRHRPQSNRVPFLHKGELLVSHTRFSAGTLKIRFPRNSYNTG